MGCALGGVWMSGGGDAVSEDRVFVEDRVAVDAGETVPVKLVSGVIEAPVPGLPRDGVVQGEPVYSDLHCPLLVEDGSIDRSTVVERHMDVEGKPAGETVHRYPKQLLVDPVSCPDCGKYVERYMLVPNAATGTRDCGIAVNFKLRGLPIESYLGKAPGVVTAMADAAQSGPIFPGSAPDASVNPDVADRKLPYGSDIVKPEVEGLSDASLSPSPPNWGERASDGHVPEHTVRVDGVE